MKKSKKLLTFAASLFALTVAVSCGGGGTSSGTPTSTDTPVSEPAVSEPVSEPEVSVPEVSEPEPEVSEPEPEVDPGLADAVAMLNEVMKDKNTVTTSSFDVPAIVDTVDYTYQVEWSLDVKADGVDGAVALGEKTNAKQTIAIKYEENFNTVDTYYDLKAVVSGEKLSENLTFDGFKVPQYKYSTIAEWINKKDTETPTSIQGVVTAVNKTDAPSAFTITDETGTAFSYDAPSVQLHVGDEVVISSVYSDFSGFPQLKAPQVVKTIATDQLAKVASYMETVDISTISENLANYASDPTSISTKYLKITGGYVHDKGGYAALSLVPWDSSFVVDLYYYDATSLIENYEGCQVDIVGTVRGISKSKITIQLQAFEKIADAPEKPEEEPVEQTWESNVVAGKEYYLGLVQENNKNTIFFTGEMDGYYFATTEDPVAEGKKVKLVETTGGYHLSFDADGTTKYINIEYDGSHKNVLMSETASTVWSYNEEYDTLTAPLSIDGEEVTYYLGTYGTYKTISTSSFDKIASSFPVHFFDVDKLGGSQEGGDTPEVPETSTYVTSVEEKKAYNLMIEQKGTSKNLYYAGGYVNTYYGASTENSAEAVDIVLKATTGGYYVGYLDNGTSTFINAVVSGTHNNIKFETTPTSVWTFNEEYDTLVTTCGENQVYMGTYGTYSTFSLSTIDKITSETSYPARLYESKNEAPEVVFPGEVTPEEPEVPEEPETPEVPETSSKIVLTVDSLGLASQSYTENTATVDGATFEWIQLGNYGNGIQVRDSSKGTSYFWNTVAFESGIEKIELTYNSAKDTYDNENAEIFYFGNDATVSSYSTKLSTTAGEKSYTITPDVNTYTFLKFEHDYQYTFYWDSIVIYLAEDASGEETTNPESVAYIFNNGTVDGVDTSYVYDQKIEGSSVEWNGLTIDATSGKLAVRDTDTQMNEGTVISFDVEAGATVVVTSYPGYHNYTVNDAAVDADAYTVTFTEASTVTIVATGSAYLYSIVVTY